jgi:FAD/FMN-containing dehydrogenase
MRRYGATVDSLIGIDAVTVDGKVIRVGADEHPDLFWGMRGGGGNFAIATAFDFQLHDAGPLVLAGRVIHASADGVEAFRHWRDVMDDAPDDLASTAVALRAPAGPIFPPDMHGKTVVAYVVAYVGDMRRADEAVEPLRSWGSPLLESLQPMPYLKLQSMQEAQHPWDVRMYARGGYLTELTDEFLHEAFAAVTEAPHTVDDAHALPGVAISRMGGAIDRVPDDAMAFSRKDAAYFWEGAALWESPADDGAYAAWARETGARLQGFGISEVYLNLTSEDGDERVRSAFAPAKYARLVELKNRWDPENLLRFNKNIRPTV